MDALDGLKATIQANAFIKSGIAKKCLVIGAETLSRVIDKHDRDSMIYSDGAGAVILESTMMMAVFLLMKVLHML